MKFNTIEDFKRSITTAWNAIDDNIINKLIDSMPKRIELVIKNSGDAIDY